MTTARPIPAFAGTHRHASSAAANETVVATMQRALDPWSSGIASRAGTHHAACCAR